MPQRVIAAIMAFGAGVLISALALTLVDEVERTGDLVQREFTAPAPNLLC